MASFFAELSDIPFTSMEYMQDGLLLSKCGCEGSTKHYLPRSHIDHVSVGRQFYFWTLLGGAALIGIAFALFNKSSERNTFYGFVIAGGILVIGSLIAMMPYSLRISTNNAIFASRECCSSGKVDELMAWLAAPSLANKTVTTFAQQVGVSLPASLVVAEQPSWQAGFIPPPPPPPAFAPVSSTPIISPASPSASINYNYNRAPSLGNNFNKPGGSLGNYNRTTPTFRGPSVVPMGPVGGSLPNAPSEPLPAATAIAIPAGED